VKSVNAASTLKVYPNPAENFLTAPFNASYHIKNILGADVVSGKATINGTINIEDLISGVYFIQFNNEKSAVKFVKK
jgi:hypothetical protein